MRKQCRWLLTIIHDYNRIKTAAFPMEEPMKSPITNCYDADEQVPRLDVESVFLYRPETQWTYSHHPHITHFAGRLHAIWSNGRENEDDVGQRVLTAQSDDFLHWSGPAPLVDSLRGKHSELVLTPDGFHEHAGTLVAYFSQYEYRAECLEGGKRRPGDRGHQDTSLFALTTRDGERWSAPIELGLPINPNHGPQPTASGRLIISGNISFPYTDDPSGLGGWTMTGIYPPEMAGELYDDSEGFWIVKERAGWPVGLCEGSFYQTDDGVLHMLLRSGTSRLWVTESRDDGASWSEPVETDFTDNVTKFHLGRLPDGRFYHVGCPDPEPRGARWPLVLSLSEDGVRFDRHFILGDDHYEMRREGLHKGGDYGYPHTMLHEGRLYVIVSRRKEAVEVLRTPLAAL